MRAAAPSAGARERRCARDSRRQRASGVQGRRARWQQACGPRRRKDSAGPRPPHTHEHTSNLDPPHVRERFDRYVVCVCYVSLSLSPSLPPSLLFLSLNTHTHTHTDMPPLSAMSADVSTAHRARARSGRRSRPHLAASRHAISAASCPPGFRSARRERAPIGPCLTSGTGPAYTFPPPAASRTITPAAHSAQGRTRRAWRETTG